MQLTLEPTGIIENVQGVPCRIWKGTDEHGVPVVTHVALVQPRTNDQSVRDRFLAELSEVKVERRLQSFDVRLVT